MDRLGIVEFNPQQKPGTNAGGSLTSTPLPHHAKVVVLDRKQGVYIRVERDALTSWQRTQCLGCRRSIDHVMREKKLKDTVCRSPSTHTMYINPLTTNHRAHGPLQIDSPGRRLHKLEMAPSTVAHRLPPGLSCWAWPLYVYTQRAAVTIYYGRFRARMPLTTDRSDKRYPDQHIRE